MAHLWTVGNDDIDSATAEIAVALRNACRVTCSEQDHYDEAMRLRNRIMEGTRALMVTRAVQACDEADETARLYDHTDASADYDRDMLWPVL